MFILLMPFLELCFCCCCHKAVVRLSSLRNFLQRTLIAALNIFIKCLISTKTKLCSHFPGFSDIFSRSRMKMDNIILFQLTGLGIIYVEYSFLITVAEYFSPFSKAWRQREYSFFSLVQLHKTLRIINKKVTSGFDLHFLTSLSILERLTETFFVSFSNKTLCSIFKTPMKCNRARTV